MRSRSRRTERYLINKLIDSMIHPLFRRDKGWVIVDWLLHCLNEWDLPEEEKVRKFIRYNLKYLLE